MRMNSCRSCVCPALAGGSTLPAFVSATRKHADVCAHVARTSGLRSSEVSPSSPSCPCATARVRHGFRPRDYARRNRLLCLSFCCGDPRRDVEYRASHRAFADISLIFPVVRSSLSAHYQLRSLLGASCSDLDKIHGSWNRSPRISPPSLCEPRGVSRLQHLDQTRSRCNPHRGMHLGMRFQMQRLSESRVLLISRFSVAQASEVGRQTQGRRPRSQMPATHARLCSNRIVSR